MKWRIWAGYLSLATIVSFAGAVSGTLAWYVYTNNVNISYGGTTVYSTEELQVGLVTPKSYSAVINGQRRTLSIALESDEDYELDSQKNDLENYPNTVHYKAKDGVDSEFPEKTEEDTDGDGTVDRVYWFTKAGAGLSSDAMTTYMKAMADVPGYGYSYSALTPVTTRTYKTGDEATFNKAPTSGEDNLGKNASHSDYSRMDFAFRVHQTDLVGADRYLSGKEIYLREVATDTRRTDGSAIDSQGALRLYFASDEGKFVFNPSQAKDGTTIVGGILDLNADGYYDYDSTNPYADVSKGQTLGYEHVYGDYVVNDGDSARNHTTYYDADTDSTLNFADNETVPSSSSFAGQHRAGVRGFEDYSSLTLGESEYLGTETVYPYNVQGDLVGGKCVAKTNASSINPVAELSTVIYLEGWDHAVIDKLIDVSFECVMNFEIGA